MDLVKRWRNHGPLVKGGRKLIAFVNLFAGNSAVGVYEFAEGYGEFTGRTENPSTAYAVPLPFDMGDFAKKASSPVCLSNTIYYVMVCPPRKEIISFLCITFCIPPCHYL